MLRKIVTDYLWCFNEPTYAKGYMNKGDLVLSLTNDGMRYVRFVCLDDGLTSTATLYDWERHTEEL